MQSMMPQTKPIIPVPPVHHPTIRVEEKTLVFSRQAMELLQLRPSSRITIEQDTNNPDDLYVKVTDLMGYDVVRRNHRGFVYSLPLARTILIIAGIDAKSAVFRLGEPTYNSIGQRIIPIITKIDYADKH